MIASKSLLVAVAALAASITAVASPVHIDVPGAHVIVVRPMDTWTGNSTTAAYSLDSLSSKKTAFWYDDGSGKRRFPSAKPSSTSPVPSSMEMLVHAGLAKHGFTNTGPSGFSFAVGNPTVFAPEQMPAFLAAQDEVFKEFVVRQGDPATLSSRKDWRKAFNVAATLAFVNVGIEKFGGMSGANFVFTLGIPEGLAKLNMNERRALAAVPAPEHNFASYRAVEVRKLAIDDRVGQIIIAYTGEKTQSVEDAALASAIVTASAADTTVQAIQKAREDDFEMRKQIWASCVGAGRCKAE